VARVLVWADYVRPRIGGIEIMAGRLLPALHACGHELEVVTARVEATPAEDVHDGIPIHRIELPLEYSERSIDVAAAGIQRAREAIESLRPELMFLLHPMALLAFYFAVQSHAAGRSIFAVRSDFPWIWEPNHMVARAIRESDFVVACSDALLEVSRTRIPDISSRSCVIRNALPMPELEPRPLRFVPPRFLCLGQLVPHKGFDTAIRAFTIVASAFPKARMTIAGDGSERSSLMAMAAELGASDRIAFPGWIDPPNVYGAIDDATAIIIPSQYEGLPQVAIQAAQMARPVLATSVSGVAEAVVDGTTGLLFPPGDAEALAAAMERLLLNPAQAAAMGAAARRRAETTFDWDDHVRRFDDLFRQMVAS
jgi:glycosyltransferase involved in cell wall biosynthesis